MRRIVLISGGLIHDSYLDPLRHELLTRGHQVNVQYVSQEGALEYDAACDLYVVADAHYGQLLPCNKPIVNTNHGLFGGGGYFGHRNQRKMAMILSSSKLLTTFLQDKFPHHHIVECGCLKLDGIVRHPVEAQSMIYGSSWVERYRTYPEMVSSLHKLQDTGWTVKVTLHEWLVPRLHRSKRFNMMEYVREHFSWLGTAVSPCDLAKVRFVLCGFSSVVTESFVLGTPVIIIDKHGVEYPDWPLWDELRSLVPCVPLGHENRLVDAVQGLRWQMGLEHNALRSKFMTPKHGKAATIACDAIEDAFLGGKRESKKLDKSCAVVNSCTTTPTA